MAQALDSFVSEIEGDLAAFKVDYLANHKVNPEHYPLDMADGNEGLWFEMFIDFCANRPAKPSND